jgi:hypothetical protein
MPLVKCPDCAKSISAAAPACPHCGRPMVGLSPAPAQADSPGTAAKPSMIVTLGGGFIALCVLFVFMAPFLPKSGNREADRPAASVEFGEVGVLRTGAGVTIVAVTKEDHERLTDLISASDTMGVNELIDRGRAFAVDDGTTAKLIGSRVFRKEVRIMGGPQTGQSGWVSSEWLQKASQ